MTANNDIQVPRFGANYTPSVDWAHAWYDFCSRTAH